MDNVIDPQERFDGENDLDSLFGNNTQSRNTSQGFDGESELDSLFGGSGTVSKPVIQEDPGFFSNMGNLAVEGGRSAIAASRITDDVTTGNFDANTPGVISTSLNRQQNRYTPPELKETQEAFKDETKAWEDADGLWEGTKAGAGFVGEMARQVFTNPKGFAYLQAEQIANMAPAIAGSLAGGKLGALAGSAVAPGPGTVIGGAVGAAGGAFAGGYDIEAGSEFIGMVAEGLAERGLEPTEKNIAALLSDEQWRNDAAHKARIKGVTTAGTDALLTVAGGRVASSAKRGAFNQARKTLGAGAAVEDVAKESGRIYSGMSKTQRVIPQVAGAGIDIAGEGLSEGAGQYAAYGEVNPQDVALETLAGVGGSAGEAVALGREFSRGVIKADTTDFDMMQNDGGVIPQAQPYLGEEVAGGQDYDPVKYGMEQGQYGEVIPTMTQRPSLNDQPYEPAKTVQQTDMDMTGNAPTADAYLGEEIPGANPDLVRAGLQQGQYGEVIPTRPQPEPVINTELDAKAHEAATSPLNDKPIPTQEQAESGKYEKGKLKLHGLSIDIENPKGSTRSGVNNDGTEWSVTMPGHYGEIKRTSGADGDPVDVYIGDQQDSQAVFIVDQLDADTGAFDEHKVIMGVETPDDAHQLYTDWFSDGRGGERFGGMAAMTVDQFKEWLKDGDQRVPVSAYNDESAQEFDANEQDISSVVDQKTENVSDNRVVADHIPDAGGMVSIAPERQEFINNKVQELGSVEAVDEFYADDSQVSQYARQTAREVFGADDASLRSVGAAASEKSLRRIKQPFFRDGIEAFVEHNTDAVGGDQVGNTIVDEATGRVTGKIPSANITALQPAIDVAGSVKKLRTAVAKAVKGDRLGVAQADAVRIVLDAMEPIRAKEVAERRTRELKERAFFTPQDIADTESLRSDLTDEEHDAYTDIVAELNDADFVERLAIELEGLSDEEYREQASERIRTELERRIAEKTEKSDAGVTQESAGRGSEDVGNQGKKQENEPESTVIPGQKKGEDGKLFATPPTFGKKAQPDTHATNADMHFDDLQIAAQQGDMFADNAPEPTNDQQNKPSETDTLDVKPGQESKPDQEKENAATLTKDEPKEKKGYGSDNKLVTKDRAEELRKKLRAKLNQINSGIDPEMLAMGTELAVFHIEAGARSFTRFARTVVAELGERAKPYLKSWYMGARYFPGLDSSGMDTAATVEALNIDDITDGVANAAEGDKVKSGEDYATDGGRYENTGSVGIQGAGESTGVQTEATGGIDEGGETASLSDGRTDQDNERDHRTDNVRTDGVRGTGDRSAKVRQPAPGTGSDGGDGERNLRGRRRVDYRITDADQIGEGGPKAKYKNNVAAIETLKTIQAENRHATPEEQAILAKYVGWGGLAQAFKRPDGSTVKGWEKEVEQLEALLTEEEYASAMRSTPNAHYTSPEIIKGMYRAVQRLGLSGGRALEPSVGAGNFLGLQPENMSLSFSGVELDQITGSIAKLLYPKQNLHVKGFQDFDIVENSIDLAIGNPPFGSVSLYDTKHKDLKGFSIHNFFFAKSIKALRPGGVLSMVVSNSMMDKAGGDQRAWMAERTRLLGAIRLPNNAFKKNAGTEVTTDIIFLQKLAEGEQNTGESWQDLSPFEVDGVTYNINEYFARHPEMMLGRVTENKLRPVEVVDGVYDGVSGLTLAEGSDFAHEYTRAINSLPENVYRQDSVVVNQQETVAAPVDGIGYTPVNGFMVRDGKILRRDPDMNGEVQLLPAQKYLKSKDAYTEFSDKEIAKFGAALKLRDALRELIAAEVSDASVRDLKVLRSKLNRVYDAFQSKHGYLHDQTNANMLGEDPDYPLLLSLENNYSKGITAAAAKKLGVAPEKKSATKAAIFTRRIREPYRPPVRANSAADALAIALNETGSVDLQRMAQLTGRTADDLLSELHGSDVFKLPEGGVVARDAYLSGNVKKKLDDALAAEKRDPAFSANVKALKEVQPPYVEAADIKARLGSTWVPGQVYDAFVEHLLAAETKIRFSSETGRWAISISGADSTGNYTTWGTDRISASDLIPKVMQGQAIVVRDRLVDGSSIINEEDTALAVKKGQEIAREFEDWLFKDSERRAFLEKHYNDNYNTHIEGRIDGSHLTFPGMNTSISLRKHQKDAVWRAIQDGKILMDHVVGAGKTFAAIAAGMEQKRMGLLRKPLYVVPNHLVSQWAEDFNTLYPGSNVLALGTKDFSAKRRQTFLARIATGDYDAVIVAHSSFGFIQSDPQHEAEMLRKEITDYELFIEELAKEKDSKRTRKQVEDAKVRLEERLKKILDTKQDTLLHFGELGVDGLFVDEAHEFKNLRYYTKLQRVSGLGDQSGSKKAAQLFTKVRYIMERNNGRGVNFLTGTPISNTLGEMFTMQRYLMYDTLQEKGLQHFDSWINNFASPTADYELDPIGNSYKMTTRLREFVNMPEVMALYKSFADVITLDHLKQHNVDNDGKPIAWPVPKIKGGKPENIVVERNNEQSDYMDYLVARYAQFPKDGKADNPLKATSDGRKMALDMRLIDPNAQDHPDSKINEASRQIVRIHQKNNGRKGTQLVFCDLSVPKKAQAREQKRIEELMDKARKGDEKAQATLSKMSPDEISSATSEFSVYDDLKAKLIKGGIAENEIAFIHDANNDKQKAELFERVRSGKVRVLIGSTFKMGAGMNVQDRLVALHHLDCPWRPSDLEQREGRIIRQGNKFYALNPDKFEIEILRYATKQTVDARMWQVVEAKAGFIGQVRAGGSGRTVEDVSAEAASFAEMKAAASGNPLVLEEVQLRKEIKDLRVDKAAHDRSLWRYQDMVRKAEHINARTEDEIADIESDLQTVEANFKGRDSKEWSLEVDGKIFAPTIKEETGTAAEKKKIAKQNSDAIKTVRKQAGEYLVEQISDFVAAKRTLGSHALDEVPLLKYGGIVFDIDYFGNAGGFGVSIVADDRSGHNPSVLYMDKDVDDGISATGLMTRLDNILTGILDGAEQRKAELERTRKRVLADGVEARKKVGKEFDGTELLKQKESRHSDVMAELKAAEKENSEKTEAKDFTRWIRLGGPTPQVQPVPTPQEVSIEKPESPIEQAESGRFYSRTSRDNTGNTTATVESEAKSFLGRGFGNLTKAGKLKIVQSVKDLPDVARGMFSAAWHGSPHRFDKFRTEHIGTGEGAQAYGYGLYFASRKEVAEYYKKSLTVSDGAQILQDGRNSYSVWGRADRADEQISLLADNLLYHKAVEFKREWDSKNTGALYQVELAPQEDEYLLWDKPLSEQSEKVRISIAGMGHVLDEKQERMQARAHIYTSPVEKIVERWTGSDLYDMAVDYFVNEDAAWEILGRTPDDVKNVQQAASEYLHSLGIRGIKYLDGTSRSQGEGDYNYVIFNDADVEITALYSKNGDIAGVYQDGTIYLVADQITKGETAGLLKHEGLHMLLREDKGFMRLRDKMIGRVKELRSTDAKVREAYGMVPKDTPAQHIDEEALAYLVQNHKQHNIVKRIMAAVRAWLVRMGVPVKNLTVDDLSALASQGVKRFSKTTTGGQTAARVKSDNFLNWFGNSKIVDESGEPKVVYHGTNADFSTFRTSERGIFFSDSPTVASNYTEYKRSSDSVNDGNVMPVYLSMQNPITVEFGTGKSLESAVAEAKANGNDGVIVKGYPDTYQGNDVVADMYIVFEPSQIKSATGNNGDYSRSNDDVRYSILRPTGGVGPTESTLAKASPRIKNAVDYLRMKLQDKFIPLLNMQKMLEERGWVKNDANDAYRAEERFHGKAERRLELFTEQYVTPLMEKISGSTISIEELESYLYAKFAPERNKYIASINESMPDGGSGMTNDEARGILAEFQRSGKTGELESLAREVRKVTQLQRDIIRNEGLELDETMDAWELNNNNYVPLKGGQEETGRGIGTGYSFKRSGTKQALGRRSKAENILSELFSQVGTTIVRAEKAKVQRAFLEMVEQNPDESLWKVYDPKNKATLPTKRKLSNNPVLKRIKRKISKRTYLLNNGNLSETRRATVEAEIAELQEQASGIKERLVKDVIDPSLLTGDNVMTITRDDGTVVYVDIADNDLARVMKNMTQNQYGPITKALGVVTRYLSRMSTSFNPEFVVTNFERDIQTAMAHLGTEQSGKLAMQVLKSVPKAMGGIRRNLRKGDKTSEWAVWYERFLDAGAQVSFMDLRGVDEWKRELASLGKKGALDGSKATVKKIGEFINDYNTVVENAVRLSAFKTAIESGMSESDAASLAKNLTVNFNRKGELGPAMNALYMFANAGIQGSARIVQALTNKRSRKRMGKLMGSVVAMSFALAELNRLSAGDDDDDENRWDKIGDYTKQVNLIFATDEGEWKIRTPYGYNSFVALGYALNDLYHYSIGDGGKSPSEVSWFMVSTLKNAFNPLGGDESLMKILSPTITDPIVELTTNENFMGENIRPENFQFGPQKPDSQLYFRTVSQASKDVTGWLNKVTGGSEWEPGMIDVSPETLDHLFGFAFGGVGRSVMRVADLPAKITNGELQVRNVPFARQIYQEKVPYVDFDRFYDNMNKISASRAAVKEMPVNQRRSYIADHPEIRMAKMAGRYNRQLSKMRERYYALKDSGQHEQAKNMQERMQAHVLRFNKVYNGIVD